MQSNLNDFASSIDHLRAIVVTVMPDSLLYDAWARHDDIDDPDETATFFGALVQSHVDSLAPSGIDATNAVITVEADKRIVVLQRVNDNYVVGLVFNDTIAFGVLRLQTRRIIGVLADLLPLFDAPVYEDRPAEPGQPLAQEADETEIDEGGQEEAVYYGYVNARDRERERQHAALREHLPTAEHPVVEGTPQPSPNIAMQVDGLRLDVDADDAFSGSSGSAQLDSQEHQTAMQEPTKPQRESMTNEGGIPAQLPHPTHEHANGQNPTGADFKPDTVTPLTTPFQERAMENEGGPVPEKPADQHVPDEPTAKDEANAMDNEGAAQNLPPTKPGQKD